MSNQALTTLKFLFQDRPEVLKLLDLREVDLSGRVDEAFIEKQSKKGLFPQPVNLYATGRTGAGKTTLGRAILDPKKTIDTKEAVMGSTGQTDCTWMVQFFQMLSNLCYFDLPGVGGTNDRYENINRAALLLPQVNDEEDDEGLKPVNQFELWNCSDYPTQKVVHKKNVTVSEWQSSESQQKVAPDIILYVVAPNTQFLGNDKKYLRSLLKNQKDISNQNRVIFALNIHDQMTTKESIEDARAKITEIYQKIYSDIPPIVEVDCLKGTGINKITELMCRILPDNKVGNMGKALQDELKAVAMKERSRRYRKGLIYIASRLATRKVDEKQGEQELLNEAYMAVADYAIRVFREEDAYIEAQNELFEMVDVFADQAKTSRQEAVTIKVNDVEIEEVTESQVVGFKPKYKDIEVEDVVPDYYQTTEKVKRSAIARGALGFVEGFFQLVVSPVTVVQAIASEFGAIKEEDILGNKLHEEFDRDAYRNEDVFKVTTKKVKRIEQRLSDMEEIRRDFTRQVPKIVQKEQEVGKKSLQGGYPVVETLLAIGLGIEKADTSADLNNFEAIVEQGRVQAKALLSSYDAQIGDQIVDKINQLAVGNDPKQAEAQIVKILEGALLK